MKRTPKDLSAEKRQFLSALRARPGLYLGSNGLFSEFVQFENGYNCCAMLHQQDQERLIPQGFTEFVAMHYLGTDRTAMNWALLILQHEMDERIAFQKFWELLDDYLVSSGFSPLPVTERHTGKYEHPDGIGHIMYTDLSEIADSYITTFNAPPWNDQWDRKTVSARFREFYRTPGFWGLAVWKDGKPIGAMLGRSETYFDGKYFQIVEFWVEPTAQKQGYARKMLSDAKRILAFQGIRKLYLITMHGDATEGFYKHHGFTTDKGLCIMELWDLPVEQEEE